MLRFQDLQFDPLFKVNRSGNVSSIVSLSSEEICSTSRDGGQVSIVSLKTGEVMQQTKLHDKDIIEVALHPSYDYNIFPYAFTVGADLMLKLINLRTRVAVCKVSCKLNNDPICKGLKWIKATNDIWLGDSTGIIQIFKTL